MEKANMYKNWWISILDRTRRTQRTTITTAWINVQKRLPGNAWMFMDVSLTLPYLSISKGRIVTSRAPFSLRNCWVAQELLTSIPFPSFPCHPSMKSLTRLVLVHRVQPNNQGTVQLFDMLRGFLNGTSTGYLIMVDHQVACSNWHWKVGNKSSGSWLFV